MGLILKISVEEQENSFYVYECTKNYGPTTLKSSDIINSFLFVQTPEDTSEYPWKIDVFGSLPNTDNIAYEVLPSQIGLNNELSSGLYKIKLVHQFSGKNGGTVTKTAFTTEVFYNNIACCIDKKIPNVDQNVNSEENKMIIDLSNMLVGVKEQARQGFFEKANKTIEYMKLQCKCSGC